MALTLHSLAPLIAALPPHWTFEFVDAPNACGPGPGVDSVYAGPYYCFFESYTPERMANAVAYVREIVEDEGPFDAVIGFSQGASVTAAYLSAYPATTESAELTFSFAIFICAALIPPELADAKHLEQTIGSLLNRLPLPIPSLHIIGKQDACYGQSVSLFESCQASALPAKSGTCKSPKGVADVVYFFGGHQVPRDAATVGKLEKAVEKTARMGFLG